MQSVFIHTLHGRRWLVFGWSLGFLLLSLLMVLFYPAMNQADIMTALSKDTPEAFKGLIGNVADMSQFSTYLASQLFDIRGSIFGGVLAVVLGLGLTIGDEDKGYMRTLLALPLSRTKVLFQKWLAMLAIMAVITLVTLLTIAVTAGLINESVGWGWLLRLGLMYWLVLVACSSLVFAAGIATGRRSVAMTLGIVVVAGSFLLSTFSTSVDWLEPYELLSIYHYFPAADTVKSGVKLSNVAVLGSTALIPLIGSWLIFRSRDVG